MLNDEANRRRVCWVLHDELIVEAEGFSLLPKSNTHADLLHIIRSVESLSIGPADPSWPSSALAELGASLMQGAALHGYDLAGGGLFATGHSLRVVARLQCGHRVNATFIELYEHMGEPTTLEMFDQGIQKQAARIFDGGFRFWIPARSRFDMGWFTRASPIGRLQAKAMALGMLIEEQMESNESQSEPAATGAYRLRKLDIEGNFATIAKVDAPESTHGQSINWIEHIQGAERFFSSVLEGRQIHKDLLGTEESAEPITAKRL